MSAEGPVFPVAFDELAMAEDLAPLGEGGVEALAALGREIDRLGGLPRERLLACPFFIPIAKVRSGETFRFQTWPLSSKTTFWRPAAMGNSGEPGRPSPS